MFGVNFSRQQWLVTFTFVVVNFCNAMTVSMQGNNSTNIFWLELRLENGMMSLFDSISFVSYLFSNKFLLKGLSSYYYANVFQAKTDIKPNIFN